MEQEPKIIYEEPKGSTLTAKNKARSVKKLIDEREVDIADFLGRIDSFNQKLAEVANDLQEKMSVIDGAIMVIIEADDLESEEHFTKTK